MRLKGAKTEPSGFSGSDTDEPPSDYALEGEKQSPIAKKSRFMRRILSQKQSSKCLPPRLSTKRSREGFDGSESGISTPFINTSPIKSLRRARSDANLINYLDDLSAGGVPQTPALDLESRLTPKSASDQDGPFIRSNPRSAMIRPHRDCGPRPKSGSMSARVTPKNDRNEFFNVFSLLIKLGNEHRAEGTKTLSKQISRDETPFMNYRDNLWLELQAWHKGRTLSEQYEYLARERRKVSPTIEKILNFRYERIDLPHDLSGAMPACDGCLSIYCQTCLMHQSRAMRIVCDLLDEIEKIEELYPSCRAVGLNYPMYKSETFSGRCKALCVWINTTRKLRMRIDIIGSLFQNSNSKVLWPQWPVWNLSPEEEETDDRIATIKLHRSVSETAKLLSAEARRKGPDVQEDVQVVGSGKIYRRSNSKVRFFLEERSSDAEVKDDSFAVDDILSSLMEVQNEKSQPNTPSSVSDLPSGAPSCLGPEIPQSTHRHEGVLLSPSIEPPCTPLNALGHQQNVSEPCADDSDPDFKPDEILASLCEKQADSSLVNFVPSSDKIKHSSTVPDYYPSFRTDDVLDCLVEEQNENSKSNTPSPADDFVYPIEHVNDFQVHLEPDTMLETVPEESLHNLEQESVDKDGAVEPANLPVDGQNDPMMNARYDDVHENIDSGNLSMSHSDMNEEAVSTPDDILPDKELNMNEVVIQAQLKNVDQPASSVSNSLALLGDNQASDEQTELSALSDYDSLSDGDRSPTITILGMDKPWHKDNFVVIYTPWKRSERERRKKPKSLSFDSGHPSNDNPLMTSSPEIQEMQVPARFNKDTNTLSINLEPERLWADAPKISEICEITVSPPLAKGDGVVSEETKQGDVERKFESSTLAEAEEIADQEVKPTVHAEVRNVDTSRLPNRGPPNGLDLSSLSEKLSKLETIEQETPLDAQAQLSDEQPDTADANAIDAVVHEIKETMTEDNIEIQAAAIPTEQKSSDQSEGDGVKKTGPRKMRRQISHYSDFTTDCSSVYPYDSYPSSRRSSSGSVVSDEEFDEKNKQGEKETSKLEKQTDLKNWVRVQSQDYRVKRSSSTPAEAVPASVSTLEPEVTNTSVTEKNVDSAVLPSSQPEEPLASVSATNLEDIAPENSPISLPITPRLTRQASDLESVLSNSSNHAPSVVSHGSASCSSSISYPIAEKLRNARELNLDTVDNNRTIYHPFVEQELKSKGLGRFIEWVDRLNTRLVDSTQNTLSPVTDPSENLPEEQCYGARSEHFLCLNLPSYESQYIFLCRIPLILELDCMSIHLDQIVVEPSILSLKELIKETKFLLTYCIKYKKIILCRLSVTDLSRDDVMDERNTEDMEIYNSSLKKTFQVYLDYMKQLVAGEANSTESFQSSRNILEEEWGNYCRQAALDIPEGEVQAGVAFTAMTSLLLGAVGSLLYTGLGLSKEQEIGDDEPASEKQMALTFFRRVQKTFFSTKERALKMLFFVKELTKDLKRAAEFRISRPPKEIVKKLLDTGHVRVESTVSTKYRLYVPSSVKHSHEYILRLMNLECFWDTNTTCSDSHEEDGYLIALNTVGHEIKHDYGEVVVIEAGQKTVCIDELEVNGLVLLTDTADDLAAKRRNFQKLMGDSITLIEESRPAHPLVAEAMHQLKGMALNVSHHVLMAITEVERKYNEFDQAFLGEPEHGAIMSRGRETINQCYKFGFEYHRDLQRLTMGRLKSNVAERIIQLARRWMRHAMDRCERGRGVRPRWAHHGLNFLTLACDPKNTKYLSETEFDDFKKNINDCLAHVIGAPDDVSILSSGYSSPFRRSPFPSKLSSSRMSDDMSDMSSAYGGAVSESSTPGASEPSCAPFPDDQGSLHGSTRSLASETSRIIPDWSESVSKAVAALDEKRDELLQNNGTIGKVKDVCPIFRVQIKSKTVNFPWQRGVKIGQGRFGKVFVAINTKTGEVYAMKELAISQGDHRALRKLADELRIFEGIKHKNLVRHYGVEIHKDEMLIFMEYCAEGTLEALIDQMKEPLPEELIRRYSRQLLEAVKELHDHGIAHRDIKSANIFLTDEGNCLKLGDYGCATKIKSHTTVAGELHGFVGTQAYMAPEVFMSTAERGHGRAADIWSVGCVVVEMATGKRPWPDLESNYAIMFRVGMGEHPEVPASFSADGKDFVEHSLTHDQNERWTAHQLLEHPFVKVGDDWS